MVNNDDLETLRHQVRDLTAQIMRNVHQRMDLSRQIGEVKNKLGIDVKDERVENEIRASVLSLADEVGMSHDFALQLLNILLVESERVQAKARQEKVVPRQTHLGIFMKAKQLEALGKKIIHMEVGEPDFPPPAVVEDALVDSFKQRKYHYTDTRGVPQLRDAIAKKERTTEDRVIVTPGGRFGVFSAITSLVKPGQEIIVIEPAWPAYKECADFIGVRTRVLRTTLEGRWTPDTNLLEAMINKSTRMIVLNYPNNPTGKILDDKTMEKIVSITKDNGLYLLSDEVYADYAFKKFTSISQYEYDNSILISSFSKRYAMTGFRVGYAVGNKEIVTKMAKVQAVGITSVAEPMQEAAIAALGEDPSDNIELMKTRLEYISEKLKEMSLQFVEPDGAMYVYPKLPTGNDIAVIEKLLERGVAIAPGSGFGDYYRQFVRISACQPEKILEKGLLEIKSVIKEDN